MSASVFGSGGTGWPPLIVPLRGARARPCRSGSCAALAAWAAASGSLPRTDLPSESSTIAAGALPVIVGERGLDRVAGRGRAGGPDRLHRLAHGVVVARRRLQHLGPLVEGDGADADLVRDRVEEACRPPSWPRRGGWARRPSACIEPERSVTIITRACSVGTATRGLRLGERDEQRRQRDAVAGDARRGGASRRALGATEGRSVRGREGLRAALGAHVERRRATGISARPIRNAGWRSSRAAPEPGPAGRLVVDRVGPERARRGGRSRGGGPARARGPRPAPARRARSLGRLAGRSGASPLVAAQHGRGARARAARRATARRPRRRAERERVRRERDEAPGARAARGTARARRWARSSSRRAHSAAARGGGEDEQRDRHRQGGARDVVEEGGHVWLRRRCSAPVARAAAAAAAAAGAASRRRRRRGAAAAVAVAAAARSEAAAVGIGVERCGLLSGWAGADCCGAAGCGVVGAVAVAGTAGVGRAPGRG